MWINDSVSYLIDFVFILFLSFILFVYECIFQLTATCDISYWCYLMFSWMWMCLFQFCYFNKKKTFYFVINIFIQFIQLDASSSLGPAGIVGGGSECTALSPPSTRRGALEQGTEPPTAPRAPQYKWPPTAPGVCSLLWVCTRRGKCRSPNSEYGSPYLAVCHLTLYNVTFFLLLFFVTCKYCGKWQYYSVVGLF